ncbi:nucleoside phosphorylase [Pseudomonas orientalis]|uniref:phosphorylase family protein n=1 Tax=Pseudomonas orientalis TaxID=76758 RepID=UPI001022FD15|nr:nucleoside phosphorylase [Pseudomonas orientalis]RZI20986.1 nucleoside phosphorylase [Pseudomonas orientalis]
MKILLIEDDKKKRQAITSHLTRGGIANEDIFIAKNMTDFAGYLHLDIGLFIIDFKLPNCDNGTASSNGKSILESIIKAGKNDALLLAISSYPAEFPEMREFYESNGCILADFANKKGWQSTLDHLLIQLKKNVKLDFIIFCALLAERNPYVTIIGGRQITRGGVDCYDIEIDGKKGTVVLLPQMGLVNAAVIAGVCIDRFKPSVVGMSGICGGFEQRANKGQLLISSMVYEYQSGKWAADGFKQEPYQVHTDNTTLTDLKVLSNKEGLIRELEEGFDGGKRPMETFKPEVGIFTSGSSVIADREYLTQIEVIHRKVNALDMEIFAVQRAAELSPHRPACICAKTVVDLCDANKTDDLHLYGSYISSKFMIRAIKDYFSKRP